MTAVHATPADRIAGRVNFWIAACLDVPPSRVLPHARLREDLGGHPLSLMRLAVAIEVDLGVDPWPGRPEDRWLTCGDVAEFYAGRAGRAA